MRLRFNHAQRYTLPVERQLKERLIGAGVLIAIAVLLVPEMFSGPRSHDAVPAPTSDASSAGSSNTTDQVKTWQVNLQSAQEAASSGQATSVEPPAPMPNAEAQAVSSASSRVASAAASSASRTASSASSASVSSAAASSSAQSVAQVITQAVAAPKLPAKLEAPGKWQVQLGSFSTEARARQIAAQLKSSGQSAMVSALRAGGKTLYRVRIQAGDSREAAQAVLKKLSASYPGAAVVPPGK